MTRENNHTKDFPLCQKMPLFPRAWTPDQLWLIFDPMQIPSTPEGRLENMAQTVWSLEEANREKPLPYGERLNLLRIHYEIQRLREEQLEIPKRDRSYLYLQEGSKDQVLLVHGGHSTPAQYIQMGKALYRAGMTVYGTLLPSEETVGSQRGEVPWQMVRDELELRFDLLSHLGGRIHVVGSSFGAILSLILAHNRPVASLSLLSPPLKPHLSFAERMALTWGRLFPKLFERLVAQSPHRWMADRYSAVREARRHVSDLECPILAVHARNNMELSPSGLAVLRRGSRNANSRALLLEEGGHSLLRGPAAPQVEKEILEFIRNVQKSG